MLSHDADVRRAFARDASGLEMLPQSVARPNSIAETAELLQKCSSTRTSVTAAGAQSSTTGASITDNGVLLSLRSLSAIGDVDTVNRTIRVGPGAIVADVRRAAHEQGLLFTPDPTSEEESTIGGAIACNASGARSLRYGATRPHVQALTVLLANGELLDIRRPQLEKNTVGFPIAHDAVDWFVGSEGTLGVVVEAELSLIELPEQVIGLAIPFSSESDALAFVVAARKSCLITPRCLEFFDALAVKVMTDANVPNSWTSDAAALVYAEDTSIGDNEVDLDAWLELCEKHNALSADIRVHDSPSSLRLARALRHAIPSTMNERGDACRSKGGRKVSTDWAVPYPLLAHALQRARTIATEHGVQQAVIYGHAGNGHPHQNFIAHDSAELAAIERVVETTLREVIALGGTVAAEHGIGKLKRRWLSLQATSTQIRLMRAVKHEFDPHGLLAPGNVL